jgi:murein L,D-transpeptidase YafK
MNVSARGYAIPCDGITLRPPVNRVAPRELVLKNGCRGPTNESKHSVSIRMNSPRIAWFRAKLFACAIVLLAGCAAPSTRHIEPVVAAPATVSEPITISENVVVGHPVAVVVTKHARRLELYKRGGLVGAFPVVLGPRPAGPKRYEGDMRTPEGVYHVTGKRLHGRWSYFIEIDYPNDVDRAAFESEAAAGRIPLFAQRLPGLGGRVGIHGNDRPRDQASGRDWTKGCIAMRNEDVAVLYDLVEVGTPVVVLP